jgi:ATP-binding cassette, subfamily G (WHITE), member 2, PDR
MHRAVLRIRKNVPLNVSFIITNAILGLIIGSIFYNLDESADTLQRRDLVLFFALVVNAFVPGAEVCNIDIIMFLLRNGLIPCL